jgi:hypothetical protein
MPLPKCNVFWPTSREETGIDAVKPWRGLRVAGKFN